MLRLRGAHFIIVTLSFSVGHETHGFRDGNEPAQIAFNGTFFDTEYFPGVGYDPTIEIDDPRRRREEHLAELDEMAPRGDPLHSRINLFTKNADCQQLQPPQKQYRHR